MLGWGPRKSQKKRKIKDKRTNLNIMYDMTNVCAYTTFKMCEYMFKLKFKKFNSQTDRAQVEAAVSCRPLSAPGPRGRGPVAERSWVGSRGQVRLVRAPAGALQLHLVGGANPSSRGKQTPLPGRPRGDFPMGVEAPEKAHCRPGEAITTRGQGEQQGLWGWRGPQLCTPGRAFGSPGQQRQLESPEAQLEAPKSPIQPRGERYL